MRDELRSALERLERADRRRAWPPAASAGADFSSNDYLGFARRPELADAMRDSIGREGTGSRAARLLGGSADAALRAERACADWLRDEAALLFPSGYQANLGAVQALAGRGDAVLSDALNHASIVDAARLSRAHVEVHAHLDLDDLERRLVRTRSARRRVVVSESVFSMDGDLAPIAGIVELCERHDAWLVLDEAHAAGLLGREGAGALDALVADGLDPRRVVLRVVTGGKSLGASGAFLVGAVDTVEYVANTARAFVFTTAPPPAVCAALERAIEVARGAEAERERALAFARTIAHDLGLERPAAAIVPFVVGADREAVALAREMQEAALDVRAVRPPTVPEGTARLRIVAHAHNTDAEVRRLVDALRGAAVRSKETRGARAASRVLCVVGTDTDVGKTVVASALALAAPPGWRSWKPVQTGATESEGDDDTRTCKCLTQLPDERFAEPVARFALPASPHEAAAAEGARVDVAEIDRALAELRGDGHVLAELAGGLLVPYDDATTQADWLARVRPEIVLVARSGLGTLNHTLLTVEALERRALRPRAVVLVGEPHPSNAATLRARLAPVPVLEMPRFERLDRDALQEWVGANGVRELLFDGGAA
ncbi:MAG: dethiobiotin synthase [Planctomycetota bacterium]